MNYEKAAFPIPTNARSDGMSLREYAAVKVAAALCSDMRTAFDAAILSGFPMEAQIAKTAVSIADALIAELQK